MKFVRIAPGHYQAENGVEIKREQTTFGIGSRAAANPMWRVYAPGAKYRSSQHATLALAKAAVK